MSEVTPKRESNSTRFLDSLSTAARWAAMVILVFMTIIIGWQVFARFVLNDTPPWSEQLATSLMVWIALLGGAVVAREENHIALTFFVERLPDGPRKLVHLLIQFLILAFSLMMVWYGTEMSLIVRNWTIPTLGFSRAFDYVAFPAAGALITIFVAAGIIKLVRTPAAADPPHSTLSPGIDPDAPITDKKLRDDEAGENSKP